jgi:hypothetical protein
MPPAAPSSQALVVGISQYHNLNKLLPTKDASGVRDVLASPDHCAYPPERVKLLEEAAATRDNILGALKEMCQGAREPSARSFFYFTGHGGQGPDGASYILPVDARRGEYPSTAISARDLSQLLDSCLGELTVVLDCCRAAGMARSDEGPGPAAPGDAGPHDLGLAAFTDSLGSAIRPRELGEKRATKRVLFAACRALGRAFTSPEVPYSIFTGHMLDCLRGAGSAATGGANVTVGQLFEYVEKHVRRDSGGSQRPLFISETESFYPLTDYPRAIRQEAVYEKDVYISYDHDDPHLEDWTKHFFQPDLENNGISIWDSDDLGARKLETREAIARSRYTIVLLTQAYLKNRLAEFTATMAAVQAIESGTRRFILILREQFALPCDLDAFVPLDMTPRREMRFRSNMDRLIKRLKKQPDER